MRLAPARSHPDVDLERHVEGMGILHLPTDQLTDRVDLVLGRFEDQLVVALEQHPGLESLLVEAPRDAQHGQLAKIGGRALDRGVGGDALARLTLHESVARELRNVAPAAEEGSHVAVLMGLLRCDGGLAI